jgi:hypothetical protein
MEAMSVIQFVLNTYLAVWIAKAILVLSDADVAARVIHRLSGRPVLVLMGWCVLGILLTTLVAWPKLLLAERWRFFLAYSRFSVIRQVVQAYRQVEAKVSGEHA